MSDSPKMTLISKHGGALAWGKNYPPKQGGKDATNGSAPGYVRADA